MSQPNQMPAQQRISDLKVSGHLMTLQTGLFCIFHTPGQPPPSALGLPGVRISRSPLAHNTQMEIVTFEPDGWIGAQTGAALVRIHQGPAQVMVTIYQELDSPHEAPRLQVVQLSAQADAQEEDATIRPEIAPQQPVQQQVMAQAQEVTSPETPEIGAHIQRQGDVAVRLGDWMGKPGSHAWIEGFGIAPSGLIAPEEIEYQAVLGKGWLSPWVEGGTYCGSRGMALPILGLCVRLKGKAAKQYVCRLRATFTDGTEVGPFETEEPIEAPTLAPLEAFLLEIVPRRAAHNKKRVSHRDALNLAEKKADLEKLLVEDAENLADISEDFALFLEDDLDLIEEEAPAPRRGRAKAVKPAHNATVPAKSSAKRGRKPAAGKAVLPPKPVEQPKEQEHVRRGRGRPARRVVEHGAARTAANAHTVGGERSVGRRRRASSRH